MRALPVLLLLSGCVIGDSVTKPPPDSLLDEARMVKVPAGRFTMGYNQGPPDEHPAHDVELDGFLIDRAEVVNADYSACVASNACSKAAFADDEILGRARHPVVGVSWRQAVRYCKWLGKRLPSEAEWEMAARAPSFSFYPWAGPFERDRANGAGELDSFEKTAGAGSFPKGQTPLGLSDMAGNVSEWTADWYEPTYYRNSPTRNPRGPAVSTGSRVIRGGSWADPPYALRTTARAAADPQRSKNSLGFRCAK